jgi:hypothetical protein
MAVESMESMEMAPGAIPRLGRVQEQRLLSPEIGLRRRRCCGTLSRKTPTDLGFSRRRLFIGGGTMSEGGQGPHTMMACKYSSLGTPRGRYDEHSSKSSLSCEIKVESNQ